MRSSELSRVRANPVREERVFSSVRRFGGVKLCAKRNMLSSAPKRPPIFVGVFLLHGRVNILKKLIFYVIINSPINKKMGEVRNVRKSG